MAVSSPVVLSGSVGAKDKRGLPADNNESDIIEVKHLLNNVSPEQGGTSTDRLDETDGSVSGRDFDKMVEAIATFQRVQKLFPKPGGRFGADGRVDRDNVTIHTLNDLVNHRPPAKGLAFQEVVQARGLDNTAKPNPFQMLPAPPFNELRLLRILNLPSDFNPGRLSIDKTDVAEIVRFENGIVTLRGLAVGRATLAIAGTTLKLDLAVKPRKVIPLNFHFVRDPRTGRGTNRTPGAGKDMAEDLDNLFLPQANVSFTASREELVANIDGFIVNFDDDFTLFNGDGKRPGALQHHAFNSPSWENLINHGTATANAAGERHVYVVRLLFATKDLSPNAVAIANVAGITIQGSGPSVISEDKLGRNTAEIVGHELGHAFGLEDDFKKGHEARLMFGEQQFRGKRLTREDIEAFNPTPTKSP